MLMFCRKVDLKLTALIQLLLTASICVLHCMTTSYSLWAFFAYWCDCDWQS